MPIRRRLCLPIACAMAVTAFSTTAAAQDKGNYRNVCQRTDAIAPMAFENGRAVAVNHFTCQIEGGFMDGGTLIGMQVYELKGPEGRLVPGGGHSQKPGSMVVYDTTEGTLALNIVDGKVTGSSSAGKGRYRSTYGAASAYDGKSFVYSTRSTGPTSFVIEVMHE